MDIFDKEQTHLRGNLPSVLSTRQAQALSHVTIMMANAEKPENQARDEHYDKPCALDKLGRGKDDKHRACANSAQAAQQRLELPMSIVLERSYFCLNNFATLHVN